MQCYILFSKRQKKRKNRENRKRKKIMLTYWILRLKLFVEKKILSVHCTLKNILRGIIFILKVCHLSLKEHFLKKRNLNFSFLPGETRKREIKYTMTYTGLHPKGWVFRDDCTEFVVFFCFLTFRVPCRSKLAYLCVLNHLVNHQNTQLNAKTKNQAFNLHIF